MEIASWNINTLYRNACKHLIYSPEYESYSSKGKNLKECLTTKLVLLDPRNRIITLKSRNLSLFYLAGELSFYFSGSPWLKDINYYSIYWNTISNDGVTVISNYGKLLLHDICGVSKMTQYEYAKKQLLKNKDTKKAVMNIYDSIHVHYGSKDNPCTMYLQFFIRDNTLDLHAYMRSNDILFGVSYDIPFFTIIQEMMFVELKQTYKDLRLGKYVHNSGSLHVYDYHYKKIEAIANDKIDVTTVSSKLPDITLETIKQMPAFLQKEKEERERKGEYLGLNNPLGGLTDSFWLTILSWIKNKRKGVYSNGNN